MLTLEEARVRAHRGATLMDRIEPGWRDQIKVNTLNIASTERCVLGQVYGSYGHGLVTLLEEKAAGPQSELVEPCGFGLYGASPQDFEPLTAAWQEELVSA